MKKLQPRLWITISIAILFFTGCQKSNVGHPETKIAELSQITSWLDNIAAHSNADRKARINDIKSLMNLGLATKVSFDDKNILVIPLKPGFATYFDKYGSSIKSILIVLDKALKISSMAIANYFPINSSIVSAETLAKAYALFNGTDAPGKFIFSNIFDRHLFEVTFKDEKIYSLGSFKGKKKTSTGREENTVCIDWYLVTTYYYEDGTTETDEEYLETDCYSGCVPGEKCDELEGGGRRW